MPSRSVQSNQDGPHRNLIKIVEKHRRSTFEKPLSAHSKASFEQAQAWLEQWPSRPLVLDSCCGVGQSSLRLAAENPDCSVIAVDKSQHRLKRAESWAVDNLLLLRADLNDFYRLASAAGWLLQKHALYYPNPWPKFAHLGRRWHGAPVFPYMLRLGGAIELRTNWRIYAEEFQIALSRYQVDSNLCELPRQLIPYTPFEEKYNRSGQALWQLTAKL